jgi:hypothetical protein
MLLRDIHKLMKSGRLQKVINKTFKERRESVEDKKYRRTRTKKTG